MDEYDRAHHEQPKKSKRLEVLRLLVEEHGMSGRELGRRLGNEAAGGFILRGERSITVNQAKKTWRAVLRGPVAIPRLVMPFCAASGAERICSVKVATIT